MTAYRKILKGTSFLSVSEAASQGCSLIRNIILARFLTKADFGVAALLGMVLTLFELSGKLVLNQQVVQSKQGDNPDFVASVQFTQFAAGTLSALLILIAASPLARLFSEPQYLKSIMALALIPFINGLNNLDVYRYARRLNFGPMVLTDLVPQVLTTLTAWPLASFFRDYRAILIVLLAKASLSTLMTHMLAENRFSMRFKVFWLKQSLHFCWPLLLNGFIQIGNFQGDSMVVATSFPLAQLGAYSVAMTIAMAPGLAILRVSSSLGLPLLAEVQNDLQRFIARYSLFAQIIAFIGCTATLVLLFCGEHVVVLLFGAKYADVGTLACWLTAAQSVRILRGAVIIASMARGDTINSMVSSLWRLSGLLLAIIVGLLKVGITWFALAALAGEVIALLATILRLKEIHGVTSRSTLVPALLGFLCVLFGAAVKSFSAISPHSFLNWFVLPIILILSAGAFALCFIEFRAAASGFALRLKNGTSWSTPSDSWVTTSTVPEIKDEIKR